MLAARAYIEIRGVNIDYGTYKLADTGVLIIFEERFSISVLPPRKRTGHDLIARKDFGERHMAQSNTAPEYREHLQQVMAIQTETIRRLIADASTPPLEMAAVLEDMANAYLDLSDEIRDFALGRPAAEPEYLAENPEEANPVAALG
jgi:hypothetical protein